MLKSTLLILLPALFAGNALAGTVEFCPSPKEIKHTQGVLTAKTESGKGEWLGVLQNAGTSVTTFANAIFYSRDDKVDGVGRLGACTYNTTGNQKVDMRYRPDVRPDVPVRVKFTAAWTPGKGPFDIPYFECTSQDLQGCAFQEVR